MKEQDREIVDRLKVEADYHTGYPKTFTHVEVGDLLDIIDRLDKQVVKLEQWVGDLQSGMYINCVYCGYRYGPKENTPVSMADVLKQHIEKCPKHPMSQLKKQLTEVKAAGQQEQVGLCPVDGGQVMLIDPCYLMSDNLSKAFELVKNQMAYIVSGFGGDGSYPIFVTKDNDGVVTSVTIRFDIVDYGEGTEARRY